jgi:hypothetical protein
LKNAGSATKATAIAAATAAAKTTAATIAAAVTPTTAATMASTTAGQTVNAGACRVRLAAGANRLAVGQVQACKLRCFQGINVTWQLVIVVATVLAATLWATVGATAFRAGATRSRTTLAIAPVVKSWVAALILAATTVTVHAFAATVALAFKTRCALGRGAA